MMELDKLKDRTEPGRVILVHPEYFQVVDQKNPYMDGAVDRELAQSQWNELRKVYEGLAKEGVITGVDVLPGAPGLEDMVFCANQSLPWVDDRGGKNAVLSNMRFDSRKKEVVHFKKFYQSKGYAIRQLPGDQLLEGMGDCIYHPFKSLLWMGHGFRTSAGMAAMLEDILGMPVQPLKLVSEYFYHLDTCFLPVHERKVLLCAEAFDSESLDRISAIFEEVVEVSREEAVSTFCLNAHCIYNRSHPVAIVPKGDHLVKAELIREGYRVIEVETSEFIKSGGSVYCMKMMYFG